MWNATEKDPHKVLGNRINGGFHEDRVDWDDYEDE
jgi:hypothetical protein